MPPPSKHFLTSGQISKLQKALKDSKLPHVRERILILLLQNDGKPQREIAQFLGCSPRTVAYWCVHGDLEYCLEKNGEGFMSYLLCITRNLFCLNLPTGKT